MSDRSRMVQEFRQVLSEALDLMDAAASIVPVPSGDGPEPLPGLLRQCEALSAPSRPAPIRTIHNFACTGGTLICKALASAPGAILFSEIDPLSRHHMQRARRPFFPTDLLIDLKYSPRPVPQKVWIDFFVAGLTSLHSNLGRAGQHVVLRDHTHSHYCLDNEIPDRPTLRAMAARAGPVVSIVTVRHPLDSYLSLVNTGWVHFRPSTLHEYCRRYLVFLDDYADVPLFLYEDFTAAPGDILGQMLDALQLAPAPDFESLMPLFALSGDSGRKSAGIAPRPRRDVPDDLAAEARDSTTYRALCDRLDYPP